MENVGEKGYTIKIQNFEGPFDLLFHLIEKNKISIYDIPINVIADQFIDYLKEMRKMDLEITSEFLVMAATLLHIKSRLLIPDRRDKCGEEEIDPREELVLRLLEYKKYKDFSHILRQREQEWSKCFYKLPELIEAGKNIDNDGLSFDEFICLYKDLLERNMAKINHKSNAIAAQIVQYEKITLKSKMKDIMRILTKKTVFRFSEIFSFKTKSKVEIATGFLAMLELTKLKKANIMQRKLFSEIIVSRPKDEPGYLNSELVADFKTDKKLENLISTERRREPRVP